MEKVQIYYQDKNVVVCYKPKGYVSQEALQKNMLAALRAICNTQDIYPVHRLDKQTDGIMVYAKNKKTAADLSAQVTDGRFKKQYVVQTETPLLDNAAELQDYLFWDKQKQKAFVVKRMRKGVKEARLKYSSLADCVYLVALYTGRTHQIRVQFASRRCPVVGDTKYGSKSKVPMRLFCCGLTFCLPGTDKQVKFVDVPSWAMEHLKKEMIFDGGI